ncbi:MAG TPA: hypothetical protein VEV44_19185, partial [Pseudoneobacillus sp.]|nr:hypothetical protein [Pseudoneobacillus sp.]
IPLANSPEQIAVSDSKLFYSSADTVYAYNFGTDLEEKVTVKGETYSSFYKPDLFVDKANNTLYIAESGLSGSNIKVLSISDYSVSNQSTYDNGYGFSYPNRKVIQDNDEIYYAGKRLDSGNLANIKGTYQEDSYAEKIVAVKGNLVFSTDDIFNRKTFTKLLDLPFETEFILSKNAEETYLFKSTDHKIYKYNFAFAATTSEYTHVNNKLDMPYSLTDWVMDEANHKLFAISQTTNQLYVINTETFQLESQQFIGSMPSDIDLHNGNLYVSNSGGTNITIQNIADIGKTDLSTLPMNEEPVQYLTTKQNPFKITTDGSSLFYATEDQHALLFNINMKTSQEQRVLNTYNNLDTYYEPDVELDAANKKLYVGESGNTGSKIFTLDASTFEVMNESSQYSLPKREVILNGSDVFYAKQRFNKDQLATSLASYTENVIFADSKYVYTAGTVYDRISGGMVASFLCPVNLIETDSSGRIFAYSKVDHAVYRFDSIEKMTAQPPSKFASNLVSDQNFNMSWNPVTADGYNVYFKTPDMTEFTKLNTMPIVDTQWNIPASQFKQWYDSTVAFKVTSLLCDTESTGSETSFTFDIPQPANLQLINSPDGKWTFTWDPVANMDGYKLYYKKDQETVFYPITTNLITSNSFDVTDKVNGEWQGKTLKFAVASRVINKESIFEFTVTQAFPAIVTETPTEGTTVEPTPTPVENTQASPTDGTSGSNDSSTGTGTVD